MQQSFNALLLSSSLLATGLIAGDNPLSLDIYNAQFPKHCFWKESTLMYQGQDENAEGTKALLYGLGVRSTQLSAKKRNHPSWYPALVGLIGGEKKYAKWDWTTTLEAEFQGPSFDPIRTTRYTAEVMGSHTFSDTLSGQVGAGIKFGIRSTTSYPIVGCVYTHNLWKFKLLYPKILLASYTLTQNNTVGAFIANTLSRTYRAKKAYGREHAVCNFNAQFAGLMWKYNFTEKTFLDAAFGYSLHADIRVGDKLNRHKKRVLNEGGGYLLSLSVKTAL